MMHWMIYTISFLAAYSIFVESILSLLRYQDLWTSYRHICELLKKEKYMYLTKTGVYRDAELPFQDLVERCETIISSENINWTNLNQNKKEDKNK